MRELPVIEDKRLLGALDYIDERFIAEVSEEYEIFDPAPGAKLPPRARMYRFRQFAAAVACLLLLSVASLFIANAPRIYSYFAGAGSAPIPDIDYSDRDLIEQIGEVPEAFKEIVEKNLFADSFSSGDRIYVLHREEGQPDIKVYDKYGKSIADINLKEGSADSYRLYELSDGKYLKIRSYDSYYTVGDKTHKQVVTKASVEKITKKGKTVFETELDIRSDLNFVCEVDDGYIISGWLQNWSDIETEYFYIYKLDKSGDIVQQRRFFSNYRTLITDIEYGEDGLVLYQLNSSGGDFFQKICLNDDFSIRETLDIDAPPEKVITYSDMNNAYPYWKIHNFLPQFDAGRVTSVIYYDDFILIISERDTKMFESVPFHYNSIPSYTETVYTAYTYDAEIIWRSAVDSTDYERLAQVKKDYDEQQNQLK